MPRHDQQCRACGLIFEAIVRWDEKVTTCSCGGEAERIYLPTQGLIDDTLPGGARWMHNLGDAPIWVETKSTLREIMQARGLVPAPRSSYCKDDRSPWATATRLRPGQRDPFLHPGDFNR